MTRILCLGNAAESLPALAEWCTQFAPLVCLESAPIPGSLFMDIRGVAPSWGGEAQLVEKLLAKLERVPRSSGGKNAFETVEIRRHERHTSVEKGSGAFCRNGPSGAAHKRLLTPFPSPRGLPLRAAVADTIGAAWAVAHFACSEGGFLLVPPGAVLDALRPLPIEALRLAEATAILLHELGIQRIEQLEAIPREELSSRFGPGLLQSWDRAVGQLAEPLPAHRPPPRFQARWSAEFPTGQRETLVAALEYLAQRVAARLSRNGRGAAELLCRLECTSGEPLHFSVGLFQPTARARYLAELLCVRFERVRLSAPVRSMHLTATATAALELRQQEFFEGSPRQNPRHLAGLIDRLSNRLGRDMVVRARLIPDAQPELAYRYVPMLAKKGSGTFCAQHPTTKVPSVPGSGKRFLTSFSPPLRLLTRPRPLPADVTARFARTWGPERIETGWWRGHAAARDYYRVETTAGRRFWVFRRLHDGHWFLHGIFD